MRNGTKEGMDLHASEPIALSPGLIAFLALLLLPALAATAIYFGAWLVADEVYAAERALVASPQQGSGFAVAPGDDRAVDGWKKALVGVCPVH
jgi:hypothetical protein